MHQYIGMSFLAIMLSTALVHAQSPTQLSVLTLMAESELQEEIGYVPDQLSKAQQQSLEHRLGRTERDFQNQRIDATVSQAREFIPVPPQPDMNQLPLFLQQYVTSIAQGLQSNDPTQGLYIMLQSAGIDRQHANSPERGQLKIQFNDVHLKEIQLPQSLLNGTQRLN